MRWTGRPSADFERLAWVLGVDVASLAEAIGHTWRRAPMDGAEDPTRTPMEWFIAGEPAQVLIGVDRDKVLIAVPEVWWDGPSTPRMDPVPGGEVLPLPVDRERLADAVDAAAGRRQAVFRWCRFCRTATAPEHLFTDDPPTCQGCAPGYQQVVF